MTSNRPEARATADRSASRPRLRGGSFLAVLCVALAQVPLASAHNVSASAGLTRWHGLLLAFVGIAGVGGSALLKRTDRLSPTRALYGVLGGIVLAGVGAVLFDGLSPDPTYVASSMPFPRTLYPQIALALGLAVAVGGFVVGWLRWPGRPRYAFLGILTGLWISYPYLVPGIASDTHPLGYAVVLATPVLVGHIVRTDAGGVVRAVLRDPVARRFGAGVGVVTALFFLAITGYLSFFPEAGVPHETRVVVLPVIYQLVLWPTLEVVLPHVPFFLALSPGQLVVVGTLSALIGLNAAVVARHWRLEERAGVAQGTVGSAAVVGSCTCGCCGPLVAKVAILAAGPSLAAPVYWVFVDGASPLSTVFTVGSIVLFTGSLLYSVDAGPEPGRSASVVPSD